MTSFRQPAHKALDVDRPSHGPRGVGAAVEDEAAVWSAAAAPDALPSSSPTASAHSSRLKLWEIAGAGAGATTIEGAGVTGVEAARGVENAKISLRKAP